VTIFDLPLLDFIPALSPHLKRPDHMADWCSMLERCETETVRAANAKPTRHHKTWTTLHGIIRLIGRRPTWRVMLIAAEHSRAEWLGEQTRVLRERAGIEGVRGQDTKRNWSTPQGGGVIVLSVGQSGIGADSALVVADDPIDEHGFGDPSVRDSVDEMIAFYTSRSIIEGRRGSVLLLMSRGDLDDPYARRVARGWEHTSTPAIIDEGLPTERAFAPDVLDLDALKAIRSEFEQQDPSLRLWNSQWMGNPLAYADGFFEGQTAFYGDLPSDCPIIWGVDAAFTQGKKSDYFAGVGLAILGRQRAVFDVRRHRRGLSEAFDTLAGINATWPLARFAAYTSGPEIGIYHALSDKGLHIETMNARWNKATRASKSAQAWRQGEILVRLGEPWSGPFLSEMHSFNGSEAGVDDQVDALVSANDAALQSGFAPKAFGKMRI
jgi:phage terminase large subunit-like protein